MSEVLIGVGTNLGDRMAQINTAAKALNALPQTRVAQAAKVYETAPVGYSDQPDFYNTVLLLETELSPNAILGACLGIEAVMGRQRNFKDGPRIIDLDVLMYSSMKMDIHELTLPHPRMFERQFVLQPMLDLFPSGRALGTYFLHRLRDLGDQGVRSTDEAVEWN